MTRRGDRERAAAVVVAALVVVGTWAVLAGGPGTVLAGAATPDAGAASQETTTTTVAERNVTVENLSAPDQVQTGTSYAVSATLTNPGDEQRVVQVNYRIVGNVLASRLVTLPGNATQTVEFEVLSNATSGFPAGTYTHGVFAGGENATAEVTLVDETTATTTETTTDTTTEETTTTTTTETATTTTETTTTTATETATTATETATTTETTTPAAGTTGTPAEADWPATVAFERQDSNGTAVTVASVNVTDGGFVVIHNTDVVEGEAVDSIVGVSEYLDAGTHENVTVRFDEPLDQSQRLVAIPYRDSNANREFDFVTSNRTADGPYTKPDSREAVNAIAVVDVTDGNATTGPTATANGTATSNGTTTANGNDAANETG